MSLYLAGILVSIAAPPSSVLLSFDEAILREWGGTTGVECTAVGGGPAEAHHLMLQGHGGQLLANVNGSHLHYQTTPHQYGTYTCSVGNISNSSTLQERGIMTSESFSELTKIIDEI